MTGTLRDGPTDVHRPAGATPPSAARAPPPSTVPLLTQRPLGNRIDTLGAVAGFPKPPCRLHLTFHGEDGRWVLRAHSEPGKAEAAAAWIAAHRPAEVRIHPGVAPRQVRAAFEELPASWASLLAAVRVHQVQLTPDGRACLYVESTPDRLRSLLDTFRLGDAALRTRPAAPGAVAAALTPRQMEALSRALALGYYEVPHVVGLRTLALGLGTSHTAAAALLRRAESVVVKNHVDSVAALEWRRAGLDAPSTPPSP